MRELQTGRSWPQLCYFQDLADIGDTYDYQPLENDVALTTLGGNAKTEVLDVDRFSATVRITVPLRLPVRSSVEGRAAETLEHLIVTEYTLYAGSAVAHVHTLVNNRAINHRLRVGFKFNAHPRVRAGGHFAVMERAWTQAGDKYPSRPLLDFLHIGEDSGLALLTRGLYEYQTLCDGSVGQVLLTLFRSVKTIGTAAGCNILSNTPKAWANKPLSSRLRRAPRCAKRRTRPSAYTVPVTAEGCVNAGQDLDLPRVLLEAKGDPVVTCFKRAADGKGLIVRACNHGGEPAMLSLRCGLRWSKVSRVDLAERPANGTAPVCNQKTVSVELLPHEVLSLRLK